MINQLRKKFENSKDVNYQIITNILNTINNGFELNDEDKIELSKLKTNDGSDALLIAVSSNMNKAVEQLLQPIVKKRRTINPTNYYNMNSNEIYREYDEGSKNYIVDEEGKIISKFDETSYVSDEVYLYDLFHKNNNGDFTFSYLYENTKENTNEMLRELYDYYYNTYYKSNCEANDLSYIFRQKLYFGENDIEEFLNTIPGKKLSNNDLFNLIYDMSNNTISDDKLKDRIDTISELLMSKCTDKSNLRSIKYILASRNIDDSYKDMIELLFVKSNLTFDSTYLETINELNIETTANLKDEGSKEDFEFYDTLYSFETNHLLKLLDKPINIIEAKYDRPLSELLKDIKNLDGNATKNIINGMVKQINGKYEIIEINKFKKLRNAGIESIDISQCDFSKIKPEIFAEIVKSGLSVVGFNKSNSLDLISDTVRQSLESNSHSNSGTLLVSFLGKTDISDIDVIDEMINYAMRNDSGNASDFNLINALRKRKELLLSQKNNENISASHKTL